MQLNITSDYAIRTILYLAMHKNELCFAAEIEQEMAVPAKYLHKITSKLKKAGIIETFRGNSGGHQLCRDPEEISIYDILLLTEKSMEINRCLEDKLVCSRNATHTCPVRNMYQRVNESIKRSLQQTTIASLLKQ